MYNHPYSISGIHFLEETFASVIEQVLEAWAQKKALRIATVNPEFLVQARADQKLRETLQAADIRIVDGFGLWFFLRLRGWRGARITGIALMEHLLKQAEFKQKEVAIILPAKGLSTPEKVRAAFKKRYTELSFKVYSAPDIQLLLTNLQCDLCLVALGIPDQEYAGSFLKEGVIIGVGGAVDFITGTQKRAPRAFQLLGIEWMWRLLFQPWRLRRVWSAVVIFPYIVICDYFRPRLIQ